MLKLCKTSSSYLASFVAEGFFGEIFDRSTRRQDRLYRNSLAFATDCNMTSQPHDCDINFSHNPEDGDTLTVELTYTRSLHDKKGNDAGVMDMTHAREINRGFKKVLARLAKSIILSTSQDLSETGIGAIKRGYIYDDGLSKTIETHLRSTAEGIPNHELFWYPVLSPAETEPVVIRYTISDGSAKTRGARSLISSEEKTISTIILTLHNIKDRPLDFDVPPLIHPCPTSNSYKVSSALYMLTDDDQKVRLSALELNDRKKAVRAVMGGCDPKLTCSNQVANSERLERFLSGLFECKDSHSTRWKQSFDDNSYVQVGPSSTTNAWKRNAAVQWGSSKPHRPYVKRKPTNIDANDTAGKQIRPLLIYQPLKTEDVLIPAQPDNDSKQSFKMRISGVALEFDCNRRVEMGLGALHPSLLGAAMNHSGQPPLSLWEGTSEEDIEARNKWIEEFQANISDYIYHHGALAGLTSAKDWPGTDTSSSTIQWEICTEEDGNIGEAGDPGSETETSNQPIKHTSDLSITGEDVGDSGARNIEVTIDYDPMSKKV